MGLSLKPEHLKHYKDIAKLLWKHGRSDIVRNAGLDELMRDEQEAEHKDGESKAEELAKDLESMGPVYIKLGQVLSSRTDILPPDYIAALSKLHDSIEPFPYEEVEQIVEEELGVRISKAFAEFEPVPLAAASLGQVHVARMRDGRKVAVKIQRPNIRKEIASDMEALGEIAAFLDANTGLGQRFRLVEMLDQFRANLIRELDYRQELRHLQQLRTNLAEFERIVIPEPIEDFSTGRVLTMGYVSGTKIDSLGPLAPLEHDMTGLAEETFRAYMKQILVDGVFHADPHPGNVFVTHDGKVALVDLGMVGFISPGMQQQLLKLLLAVSEGKSDEAAKIAVDLGEKLPNFDREAFTRQVADLVVQQQNTTVADIQIGRLILEVVKCSGDNGLRTPPEFTMLGKTLMNLDEVGRSLDPRFDPNAAIRRNAAEIMRQRMLKSATPGNVFATAIEMREFLEELPRRVNGILDKITNDDLHVNVEAIDEDALIAGFQKVANRIATGLVLAALIIGAAQLMRIQTSYQILGYPALAMVLFLLAAAGGFGLVATILMNDRRDKAKPKRR